MKRIDRSVWGRTLLGCVLLLSGLSGCAGGGYTYFQSHYRPIVSPGHPEADDQGKVTRYVSEYKALDGDNRAIPGKPKLFGLRRTYSGKDILPPVYTSMWVFNGDVAMGQRQGAATWERYDVMAKKLEPLPFENAISAVGSYSGAKYWVDRGNVPSQVVGYTRHEDGRYTVWLLDRDAKVTGQIDNVAHYDFRQSRTRAQDSGGDPQSIHYFGRDRYFVHQQDGPEGQVYGQFYNQAGQATSPEMPPLAWHFGGPMVFSEETQEKHVEAVATIVIDPVRNLYWPLQPDGSIRPMPEEVRGVSPVSNPEDGHTFGWFVLWELDGVERWSLLPNFDDVLDELNPRFPNAHYAKFEVVMETHHQGAMTRELPTAVIEKCSSFGEPTGRYKAFRWEGMAYGMQREELAHDEMLRKIAEHSATAKVAAQRVAAAQREAARQAEIARQAKLAEQRQEMLRLMEAGDAAGAERIAFDQGNYAISVLANAYPSRVSPRVLSAMVGQTRGSTRARWNTLLAAHYPPPPPPPQSTQSSGFTLTRHNYKYMPSNASLNAGAKIGAIYDKARFDTKMQYLRGNQSWYLD